MTYEHEAPLGQVNTLSEPLAFVPNLVRHVWVRTTSERCVDCPTERIRVYRMRDTMGAQVQHIHEAIVAAADTEQGEKRCARAILTGLYHAMCSTLRELSGHNCACGPANPYLLNGEGLCSLCLKPLPTDLSVMPDGTTLRLRRPACRWCGIRQLNADGGCLGCGRSADETIRVDAVTLLSTAPWTLEAQAQMREFQADEGNPL